MHPLRLHPWTSFINDLKEKVRVGEKDVLLLEVEAACEEALLRVHSESHVSIIKALSRGVEVKVLGSFGVASYLPPDTPVVPGIFELMLHLIGGAIQAGRMVWSGSVRNAMAFGGQHHALTYYSSGFCYFNDVAVMIEWLREKADLRRVAIFDFDGHHGNGTQFIYNEDPDVLYISFHQTHDPFGEKIYPGTGWIEDIGAGEGKGFKVNLPLPVGATDEDYDYALNEVFRPLVEEFKPELLVANGGFDAHRSAALLNLSLTLHGYLNIAETLVEAAEKVCGGRLVVLTGVGYSPEVVRRGLTIILGTLLGKPVVVDEEKTEERGVKKEVIRRVAQIKGVLKEYWGCYR